MNTYKTYNRVQQLKKFYKNLMWFGIITVILIGKDWLQDDLQYTIFGGHLLLAIWAIVLLFKGISLFIFNNEWERKMLEKETAKN
ncbi:MAG TPA: hypothetical protein DIT10_10795 [Chryseobacterium sp.]|nr:hypothetical protein [Chryseobacterium sp.]